VLACPTPAASPPPTNPAPEPATAGDLIRSGRLRWLLPLAAWWHATVSTVPPGLRAGQTARPDISASTCRKTALLVGAGPTPSPEDGQSQAGRDPCDQGPDANNETGRGWRAVRPTGRTSWRPTTGRGWRAGRPAGLTGHQPTKGRFTTGGQRP
jgi:hypothetical protein